MRKQKNHQQKSLPRDAKKTRQAPPEPMLSAGKRVMFWLLAFCLPFLALAALEIALRFAGFGEGLLLARRIEENGKTWWQINQNVGRRYFGLQPEFARQAEDTRIAFTKPANGFRIICLGESTMAGFPYNKNATMPGILRAFLTQLLPDRDVEVVNLGIAAVNSFAVLDLLRDVTALDPDAILVYVGHNEFYGALGVASTYSVGTNRPLINLYLRLLRLRAFVLLQKTLQKLTGLFAKSGSPAAPEKPVMLQMAGDRAIPFGSALYQKSAATFAGNLSDILAMANAEKIPLVVGDLVASLKDQPPFVSAPTMPLAGPEKTRWQRYRAEGEHDLQTGELAAALAQFRTADSLEPGDAEISYNLARVFFALGDTTAAGKYFSRARDLDRLRFRAPDTFNVIIRSLCAKYAAPVANIERLFRDRSTAGIIGSELITEHLHPSVSGYLLMAKAYLYAMSRAKILPAEADSIRIASLPENLDAVGVTVLDQEIGRLRIRSITSAWPFKTRVDLAVAMSATVAPVADNIATRYIERRLNWGEAHLQFADKLVGMRQYPYALAEYRALIREYPEEATLVDKLGETLISLQRYDEALTAFRQSIKIAATSPFSRAGIGKALMFLSRFAEADLALAEAIKLDNQTHAFTPAYRSFVFYLWGGALTNLRRYQQAQDTFQEALQVDPDNHLARSFLATLQKEMQKAQAQKPGK